jgi:hypothetical protein
LKVGIPSGEVSTRLKRNIHQRKSYLTAIGFYIAYGCFVMFQFEMHRVELWVRLPLNAIEQLSVVINNEAQTSEQMAAWKGSKSVASSRSALQKHTNPAAPGRPCWPPRRLLRPWGFYLFFRARLPGANVQEWTCALAQALYASRRPSAPTERIGASTVSLQWGVFTRNQQFSIWLRARIQVRFDRLRRTYFPSKLVYFRSVEVT